MSGLAVVIRSEEDLTTVLLNKSPSIFELRLDYSFDLFNLIPKLQKLNKKVLLTLRSKNEGGEYESDPKLLHKFYELGTENSDMLDLEIERDYDHIKYLLANPDKLFETKLVISAHYFAGSMGSHTEQFIAKITELGVDRSNHIVKFVGNPLDLPDLFKAISFIKNKTNHSIVLGMGQLGIVSRTLSVNLDQVFVFGGLKYDLLPNYKKLMILISDKNPTLIGLVGSSLSHSMSPQIYSLFLKRANSPGFYHLFPIKDQIDLQYSLKMLHSKGIGGLNVTFPFKQDVVELCHELSAPAKLIKAVNTIKYDGTKIIGYNTDISGFKRFFESNELTKYNSIFLIGAGGASRAVIAALMNFELEIYVTNRTAERFDSFHESILSRIQIVEIQEISQIKPDIIINATSIGLTEIPESDYIHIPTETKIGIDLVYSVEKTYFCKLFEANGLKAYDGKEMLFHQAADSFEIWTGETLDRETLFNEFLQVLIEAE